MPFIGISTNVILVIAGIGLLIFVHELGHFLVAKKIGVRVLAFSLGFGPAILRKKIGETDYRLSLFPLGGYVKLAGEQKDESCTGDEGEFSSKRPGQRAAVLVAGVTCNTIFAFVAFIIAFRIGVPFVTSEIGQVIPGWPAWEAGILPGDKITRVNNISNPDFEDVFVSIALNNSSEGLNVELERDGKIQDVRIIPRFDPTLGIQRIGIAPATSLEVGKIFSFGDSDAPAQEAGLEIGDTIIAVNGTGISTENEFRELERSNPGKELVLSVLRDDRKLDLKITPSVDTRWMIGLSCTTLKIDSIKYDCLANSIGLNKGDEIVKVNSQSVAGYSEFVNTITSLPDGKIELEIIRSHSTKLIEFNKSGEETVQEFLEGFTPSYGLTVDATVEGFPSEKAGIKPGDKIVSLNGEAMTRWEDLLQVIAASKGEQMEIAWTRGNEKMVEQIIPIKSEESAQGRMGIRLKEKKITRKYGLLLSCVVGTQKAIINIKRIYLTLQGFVSQKLSTKALGGPVLIAQASYESAKSGIGKLVYFLAIISINLAVLNILPVPVLDGGHLLFIGIEKIKGSPVSERTLVIANYIGLALILSLVIYATKNDIMRIFQVL
ncbi:MAG: RIP metalloprotease RseP [Candidatus Scalindua sp.]|nr:RIP metalloprotease RseP [Candidatus Scalindua sp.]